MTMFSGIRLWIIDNFKIANVELYNAIHHHQSQTNYRAVVAVGVIIGIGSLLNVSIAERIDTKIHNKARIELENNKHKDGGLEKLADHDYKYRSIKLKASSRFWTAVAIICTALGYIIKPD